MTTPTHIRAWGACDKNGKFVYGSFSNLASEVCLNFPLSLLPEGYTILPYTIQIIIAQGHDLADQLEKVK